MIFNMISAGSGGTALRVEGGTVPPLSPEEDTLWVNTDQDITGYAFSSREPENPGEGTVWIRTALESTTPINLSEENPVYIYPCACSQYLSGAWTAKTASVYQNGAWVSWLRWLVEGGDGWDSVTGGWASRAMKPNPNTVSDGRTSVNFTDSAMEVSLTPYGAWCGAVVTTVNKVDVTGFNTLRFVGTSSGTAGDTRFGVSVWTELGTYQTDNLAARLHILKAAFDESLDLSAVTGEVYIGIHINNEGTSKACKVAVSELSLS